MFFRRARPFLPSPEKSRREAFTGISGYLQSEAHSLRAPPGSVRADSLVELVRILLEAQSAAIEAEGGKIEQFVGDSTIAWWPPQDPAHIAAAMYAASRCLLDTKPNLTGITYRLGVRFTVGELAGAWFGPTAGQRYQVIGRARDRARGLPAHFFGKDWIVTDRDTLALLSGEVRKDFAAAGPAAFVHLL